MTSLIRDSKGRFVKGYKNPKYAMVERKCLVCGDIFTIHKCRAENEPSKGKYCSRKCKGLAFRGIRVSPDTEFKITTGTTDEYSKLRNRHSQEFAEWRNLVFKRDDYTCNKCGTRGTYLQAHHIKPFVKNKEYRFDVDNGITYCISCHAKIEYQLKKDKFKFTGGKL